MRKVFLRKYAMTIMFCRRMPEKSSEEVTRDETAVNHEIATLLLNLASRQGSKHYNSFGVNKHIEIGNVGAILGRTNTFYPLIVHSRRCFPISHNKKAQVQFQSFTSVQPILLL